MLQHARHLVRSIAYNKGSLAHPVRAAGLARAWTRNEVAFLRRTGRLSKVLGTSGKELERCFEEARPVMEYCAGELRKYSTVLPGLLNPNYGPVIYAAIRVLKPEVVVETGVASGTSSTFFLSAMEKNGTGRLYSIDLPLPNEQLVPTERRTGWLVPSRLRERWELTLGDAKVELPRLLDRLGTIDCFYHDSDHSYEHMTWEFSTSYPRIRPGGLLLSDDITNNAAWKDFTKKIGDKSAKINRTGVMRRRG